MEGGHSHGRCGIAANRLKDDGGRGTADLAQLLGHDEPVALVADHQRRSLAGETLQPQSRILQQGQIIHQREELFRIFLAGQRPQTGS
jgi:hypothetical protein